METELLQATGELGMILLGMVVMTEGLRELTGEAVQCLLARFTKSLPRSGDRRVSAGCDAYSTTYGVSLTE